MLTDGIIKQCTIVLTRGCNLRCNFCYVKSAGYIEDDKIEYDDLKNIVDFCCEAKVKYIFLPEENLLHTLAFLKSCNILKQRSIR